MNDEIKEARKRRKEAQKREARRLREPMSDDTKELLVIAALIAFVGLLVGGFTHLMMWILR